MHNDHIQKCNCKVCKSKTKGYVYGIYEDDGLWCAEISHKLAAGKLTPCATLTGFEMEPEAHAAAFGFVRGLEFRGTLL